MLAIFVLSFLKKGGVELTIIMLHYFCLLLQPNISLNSSSGTWSVSGSPLSDIRPLAQSPAPASPALRVRGGGVRGASRRGRGASRRGRGAPRRGLGALRRGRGVSGAVGRGRGGRGRAGRDRAGVSEAQAEQAKVQQDQLINVIYIYQM